ncbi:hypothetical protein F3Y22_tig00117040pilonHSYRG00022 [Hibiscus syriacus]|uniref:FAS1 domain-containing protein n=1 Tax=Hibiscus syriacus TaxID=106335 RepID=A0A6A2WB13_HIBSY|nr:hypothetical protein F3Y22_tig00117040pilonHSYRG00022 [Hibiscus syriacus]
MACSSNWWRAPVYFTISVLLAFLAISTALRSLSRDESLPTKSAIAPLLLDASTALRKSGFNLLQITPRNLHLLAAFHHLRHPGLFHRKCFPRFLALEASFSVPRLSSSASHERTLEETQRLVEINRVLVSHPDIFLDGPLMIHGVLGWILVLNDSTQKYILNDLESLSNINKQPLSLVSEVVDTKNFVEWTHVIRLLSSKGFVLFAIGLNSIVRLHIVPRKLTYMELASLPANASLSTLVPGHLLQVSEGVKNTRELMINEAKIVAPNIFESKKFVIHEISQAFELDELPNISR